MQERTISNSQFPFIDHLNMFKKKQDDSSSHTYDDMKNKLKTIVNIKPEEDTSGVSTKNEVNYCFVEFRNLKNCSLLFIHTCFYLKKMRQKEDSSINLRTNLIYRSVSSSCDKLISSNCHDICC